MVEYNQKYVREMDDKSLEEALSIEAVRILLKHPYERKPDGCCDQAIAVGSNITIGDNYRYVAFHTETPSLYKLQEGQCYEWYSRQIQEMMSKNGDNTTGSGNEDKDEIRQRLEQYAGRNQDLCANWDEDEMAIQMINGIIEKTTSWGSLTGNFAERIKASTKSTINWRMVMSGFRASILSSKRRLTRMRPNRRTGFQNLGSIRDFNTKLLVAVDVSGSITSESLSYFFGVINSAFKYGFESVDLVQFDSEVKTCIVNLKKIKNPDFLAVGRGGTDFQPAIDLAFSKGYDGLMILTDGYAPQPIIPEGHTKLIWVCEDKTSYEAHHSWMGESGRVCYMNLR